MQLRNLCAKISPKIIGFYCACVLLTLCWIPVDAQTKIFVFCTGLFTLSALVLILFPRENDHTKLSALNPLYGIFLCAVSAVFSSVAFALIYQSSVLNDTKFSSLVFPSGLVRIYLLFWPITLINYYLIFEADKVSDFLFRHRWGVAAFFAFVLIAAKIHFYNVSCFSPYIQPDCKTAFTMPVFGTPRDIRSDEWLVNIPRSIVSGYSDYGKYNYILRGTENYNIASSGLYLSYSAFSNVFNLGYYLFGSEYGLSFFTVTCLIFSFMIAFEFSYIITGKKRLPALLGASLIGLSQFSLWWSMVLQIPALLTIIVCAYYFFEAVNTRSKLLFAAGVALAGAMFICNLYPAWQVPFAYVILSLLIWVFTTHWNHMKAMRKGDWLIIIGAFAFMCSVVLSYLYNNQAYFTAVMATEYPGARLSSGGYAMDKLLTYPASLLYPFKNTGNNSEAGTFFNLFPLPIVFAVGVIIQDACGKIKDKSQQFCDPFILWLMIPTVFLFVYCTVGIPELLAKLTLISYSPEKRAIDILGFTNTLLLIRILGMDKSRYRWSMGTGAAIILAGLLWTLSEAEAKYAGFMSAGYIACITILVLLFGAAVFCQIDGFRKARILLAVTAAVTIPGLSVLPVTRGLDSVLEKPASFAVQEIVNESPDAKWIALGGIAPPQFLISNGASTINSNNYIPNMELWRKLDPDGDDNEVYNRYSHVEVQLTEGNTDFELISEDYIRLILSYSDFDTVGVRYIFSVFPISEESEVIDYSLLYAESDSYIYEVIYH